MRRLYSLLLIFILAIGTVSADNTPVAFKLYPNPLTGDVLQVNFDVEFKVGNAYTFVITNVIGQVVYTHNLTDDEMKKGSFTVRLDEVKLDKGVYLAKMVNGDHSSVQKLVVR
ncbi:MAG: T9SS type A sorting domain-containing protein [Bacteroidia bacterium]|nr:T9SS type A sorting domain-containing protein [Bacteroidia bacterium]